MPWMEPFISEAGGATAEKLPSLFLNWAKTFGTKMAAVLSNCWRSQWENGHPDHKTFGWGLSEDGISSQSMCNPSKMCFLTPIKKCVFFFFLTYEIAPTFFFLIRNPLLSLYKQGPEFLPESVISEL